MPSYDELTPNQKSVYYCFVDEHGVTQRDVDLPMMHDISEADFSAVFAVLPLLENLVHLNLLFTNVGDEAIIALAKPATPDRKGHRGCLNLTELCLSHCENISGDAVIALAEAATPNYAGLRGFPRLERLYLNDTKVGSAAIEKLATAIEMGAFPKLKLLDIHDTPALKGFPKSLYDSNKPRETLRRWIQWYRTQTGEIEGINLDECRLFLVGESRVGKTSLRHVLLGEDISPGGPQNTWGIEIYRDKITDRLVDGREHTYHLWDFGGQHIMHGTHTHYFSEDCVYLLVLDCLRFAEHDNEENTNQLSYWLKIIRRYAGDSPVIVVRSKSGEGKDQLGKLDFKGLNETYGVNLVLGKPIDVNCPPGATAEETALIKERVLKAVDQLLSDEKPRKRTEQVRLIVHGKVGHRFRAVREDLMAELKRCGKVSKPMYFEGHLCAEHSVPELDRNGLLELLHLLGDVLHYRNARAREIRDTIFDIEWIHQGIYSLLHLRDIKGALSAADVKDRMEEDPRNCILTEGEWEQVLLVLQQFKGCWMVSGPSDGLRRFVIPPACGKMPDSLKREWKTNWASESPLSCEIEAVTILHRLAVELALVIGFDRARPEFWRDGAILVDENGEEVAMSVGTNETIHVAARGESLRVRVGEVLSRLWKDLRLNANSLPEGWQKESFLDRAMSLREEEKEAEASSGDEIENHLPKKWVSGKDLTDAIAAAILEITPQKSDRRLLTAPSPAEISSWRRLTKEPLEVVTNAKGHSRYDFEQLANRFFVWCESDANRRTPEEIERAFILDFLSKRALSVP